MPADLLQRVIDETGCSRATVYRALQGSPLVSVATKEKIEAVAGRLGFRLNPLVGEWMARVRQPGTQLSRQPLLYLAGHSRAEHEGNPFLTAAWHGARQRARELGFSIEISHADRRGHDWEATGERIRSRGIRGVIISRFPPHSPPVNLPWHLISTVAIGFTASHPPIHTVASHGFETMRNSLEQLNKRGYRRPGYACSLVTERIGGSRHTADFLACREFFPEALDVPVLRQLMEGDMHRCKSEFLAWFRRHVPDLIVSNGITEYFTWLKEEGILIPDEVGYFHIGLRPGPSGMPPWSGIPQPGVELGRSAVDAVAMMLYHGETGLPRHADILQGFADSFQEGSTLKRFPPAPHGIRP